MMRFMTMAVRTGLICCLCGAAGAAIAGPVSIQSDTGNSTQGLGAFTGSVNYTHIGGNMGTLIVELTNTSPAGNGGYLTAFLFNINSADSGASATLSSTTDPDFLNITGGGLDGAPFGFYEAGAGLNGSYLGGGSPLPGIAVGATETFTFDILASDAAFLTSMDFVSGQSEFDFLTRFRGFNNNGSDKVPGVPLNIVPLPPAVFMGVAALPLVLFARRRMSRTVTRG